MFCLELLWTGREEVLFARVFRIRLFWYLIADAFVRKSKHRVGMDWFDGIRDDALCKVYFRRKLEYGNYFFKECNFRTSSYKANSYLLEDIIYR